MTATHSNSRSIGKYERFFSSLTRIGLYNNFAFAVVLKEVLDYEIHKPLLAKCLRELLLQNPLLACNVSSDDVFVVDSVKFNDVVQFWYVKESITETLAKVDKIRFVSGDRNRVLFKMIIVNGSTVLFVFDHTIYDGVSSVNMGKLFMQKLNSCTVDDCDDVEEIFVKEASYNYQIPPAIETISENVGPIPVGESPATKPWKSGKAYKDSNKFFEQFSFTPEESMAVKRHCTANNVTMTPFLQHSFLLAENLVLKDVKDLQLHDEVTFGVDDRRFIKPEFSHENTLFGCNSAGYFDNVVPSLKFNWERVRTQSDTLAALASDGSILFPFGSYAVASGITDWDTQHSATSMLNGSSTRGSLMLTNLGYHRFESDRFHVEKVFFSQSTCNLGFMFALNVVTSEQGMAVVCTMVEGEEFTAAHFEAIVSEFKKILLNPDDYA